MGRTPSTRHSKYLSQPSTTTVPTSFAGLCTMPVSAHLSKSRPLLLPQKASSFFMVPAAGTLTVNSPVLSSISLV